jgi:hypothetical protein
MPINHSRSASDTTLSLKARVLAVYHSTNPGKPEFINSGLKSSEYISRRLGSMTACCSECTPPGEFANIQTDFLPNDASRIYNGITYNNAYYVSWDPMDGVDYTFQFPDGSDSIAVRISNELYHVYANAIENYTITASNACGTSSTPRLWAPCFLAGSLVQLANGQTKAIEDVRVGDIVMGAFGEENMVLALHRPVLGNNLMCKINGNHSTTNHHPHISVDKQFYCNDPQKVDESTYGQYHDVINAFGTITPRYLHGLKKGRVQQLTTGIQLKTINGSRPVSTIETYSLPPETQLYNLVMGGSHTYHVDGYAVTGWPREDDFDYDMWVPK